jgi:alpha-beta hydrolase superfamily lysophospholipase
MHFTKLLTLTATLAIAAALWNLHDARRGIVVTSVDVAGTPTAIYRREAAMPGPVVLIAHGFAGSQQLMQPFALTFARNGYIAVTFDLPGRGRNPQDSREASRMPMGPRERS